jgi:hypothetical protein
MKANLQEMTDEFQAGRLKYFIQNWENITTDAWIIKTVQGCEIEFFDNPVQAKLPNTMRFNRKETQIIDNEIKKNTRKGSNY